MPIKRLSILFGTDQNVIDFFKNVILKLQKSHYDAEFGLCETVSASALFFIILFYLAKAHRHIDFFLILSYNIFCNVISIYLLFYKYS